MDSSESVIDSILRFDNYFVIVATHEQGEKFAQFEFLSTNIKVAPEFSYEIPRQTNGPDLEASAFVYLFWVNDGYELTLGEKAPLRVFQTKNEPFTHTGELADHDYAKLFETVESANLHKLWKNRLLWEILTKLGDREPPDGIFLKALGKLGWDELDQHAGPAFYSEGGKIDVKKHIRFQALCVNEKRADRMPEKLREAFLQNCKDLDLHSLDRPFVEFVAVQLKKVALEEACAFILRALEALPVSRENVYGIISPCLPEDSKWWIGNVLKDTSIGLEQVVDALNSLGAASSAQHCLLRAEVLLSAACKLGGDCRSAWWNLGYLSMSRREMSKAESCFSTIDRHYSNRSIATMWPTWKQIPWPHHPLETDLFSLPNDADEWPLISIITPSYNQGEYIEETILSVLNQNYPKLQFIIVDANSDDETGEVLERYRDRVDKLIIEADDGQTQAINKGLRLAEGELLAWLNSDDMYAPGALHQIAIRWIQTRADVIAGMCAEHRDKSFAVINKPSATPHDFSPEGLARIFPNWFAGDYFFQPETFFTRNIINRVGLLDESLHYAMDYDLWIRFSSANARLEVMDWPCAFFRLHDSQKTAQIIESIAEQCAVRNRYHPISIRSDRLETIKSGLEELCRRPNTTTAFFPPKVGSESLDAIRPLHHSKRVFFPDSAEDKTIDDADVVVISIGANREEINLIETLRHSHPELLLVGWFHEIENDPRANHEVALLVDIIVPTDSLLGEYLRNEMAFIAPATPPNQIASLLEEPFQIENLLEGPH